MQKARRHPSVDGLRPLVSVRFQVLFTPLHGVLFTFPSQYWFTIGLSGVFSLTRWCWQIHAKFHRLRTTQDTDGWLSVRVRDFHPLRSPFPEMFHFGRPIPSSVLLPPMPVDIRFGLIRFRSPLLTESLLFSPPPGT